MKDIENESKHRCGWCESSQIYKEYHDNEWGQPVHDDQYLFEMLILEGAQAGLSWITVLKKREHYRMAYDNFDAHKMAYYDEIKIEELLQNAGIIRNKLKIKSAILNAKAFLKIVKEFGSFDTYIWQFVNNKPIINTWENYRQAPTRTPESDAMSKDLLKRGFKFVGSTICYAFMQAVGMVSDHEKKCFLAHL